MLLVKESQVSSCSTAYNLVQTLCSTKTSWAGANDEDVDFAVSVVRQ